MSNPDKTGLRTAPIIPGAVYRKKVPISGRYEYGTMLSAMERDDGTMTGELARYRQRPSRVQENHEDFDGWELYAQPVELDEVIRAERIESAVERAKRLEAERESAAAEEARLAKARKVKAFKDENPKASWADTAREFDLLSWNVAKKLYNEATAAAA